MSESDSENEDVTRRDKLINYYGACDQSFVQTIERVSKGTQDVPDPPVYQTQKTVAHALLNRILLYLENEGNDLSEINDVQFQIFTPNRNILQWQTINRALAMPNVLPSHISEKDTYAYMEKRVTKLNSVDNSEEVRKRATQPGTLFLNIIDEAHHSATSRKNSDEKENENPSTQRKTPHMRSIQPWNSRDHPFVINIYVSATPLSLLTSTSRFHDTVVGKNHLNQWEVSEEGSATKERQLRQKFKLHEVNWTCSHDEEYLQGKRVRLQALTDDSRQKLPSYAWLSCHHGEKLDRIVGSSDIKDASIYVIQGTPEEMYRIECEHGKLWTVENDTNELKMKDENETALQKFDIKQNFGESLIAFNLQFHERQKVRFNVDKSKLEVFKSRGGSRDQVARCPEAPICTTFLMLPPDDHTKTYLSLNHMINSMRYRDEDKQHFRMDEAFETLSRHLEPLEVQISSYCLSILIYSCIEKYINQPEPTFTIDSMIKDGKELIRNFCKLLDERHRHKSITSRTFKAYLKLLTTEFIGEAWDEAEEFLLRITSFEDSSSESFGDSPHEREDLEKLRKEILFLLGASGAMIEDCLSPYENSQESGNMVIIRVNRVESGIIFKQSLCMAKMTAKLYKFEVIQDFHGELTTLDKHIESAIHDAKFNNCFEALNILKRIQTDDCRKLTKKEHRSCNCDSYHVNEDPFELKCSKCLHYHLNFDSYQDLHRLPCILILVNKGQMGDTFPHSLVAMDDRVNHIKGKRSKTKAYWTNFVQEKGRLCRYTTLSKKLPYCYIGSALYEKLKTTLRTDCTYYNSFVPHAIDPKVIAEDGVLKVKEGHADFNLQKEERKNHFLLYAEPQCGKTGVILYFIKLCRDKVDEVQMDAASNDSESDDNDEENEIEQSHFESFKNVVPHWKDLTQMPGVPLEVKTKSKYISQTGPYKYPVQDLPDVSFQKKSWKGSKRDVITDLSTQRYSHANVCKTCSINTSKTINLLATRQCYPCEPIYENFFEHLYLPSGSLPIMIPSYGRADCARLNWKHLLEDQENIVLVFVRSEDYDDYVNLWSGQVAIVEITESLQGIEETSKNGGPGFCRRYIQLFCDFMKIPQFFMADDTILYIKGGIGLSEDKSLKMKPISMKKLFREVTKIGNEFLQVPEDHQSFQRYEGFPEDSNAIQSYSGPLPNFGVIGFRKTRLTHRKFKSPFSKTHVQSLMYLNNKELIARGVLFKPWKFWEDLTICNEADEKGLHVVKLKNFEFSKVILPDAKESSTMYLWKREDDLTKKYSNLLFDAIQTKVTTYIQTLRIGRVSKKFREEFPCFTINTCSPGSFLCTLDDLEDLENCRNVIVLTTYEKLQNLSLTSFEDIQNLFQRSFKDMDNFAIQSIAKPCMENDIVVIQVTFRIDESQSRLSLRENLLTSTEEVRREMCEIDEQEMTGKRKIKEESAEDVVQNPKRPLNEPFEYQVRFSEQEIRCFKGTKYALVPLDGLVNLLQENDTANVYKLFDTPRDGTTSNHLRAMIKNEEAKFLTMTDSNQ